MREGGPLPPLVVCLYVVEEEGLAGGAFDHEGSFDLC